jgi:hypothetical protein
MIFMNAEIANRLSVVTPSSLLRYESVSRDRVSGIVESLREEQTFQDPVIFDPSLGLLIDGHHRVAAATDLGLKYIPAYSVNYLGEETVSLPLYRFFDCDAQLIMKIAKHIIDSTRGRAGTHEGESSAHIDIRARSEECTQLPVESLTSAIIALHRLTEKLEGEKHSVIEMNSPKWGAVSSAMMTRVTVYPSISKSLILQMARSEKQFPPHINKHIFDSRVIGLGASISSLSSTIEEAQGAILDIVASRRIAMSPLSIENGDCIYSERQFDLSGE